VNKNYELAVKCLFCSENVKGDTSKEYKSGDLIKCLNCGELNDYDSLMEVTKEESLKVIKDELLAKLSKQFSIEIK